MAREQPTIWGCGHHYPVLVVPMGGGKQARCLGCGTCGPAPESSGEAMRAMRALREAA